MAIGKPYDPAHLSQAIDDYYQYNPDTLMPLLMLALAAQGQLQVGNTVKPGATVFASISIPEVGQYEWVKLNPALKRQLKAQRAQGATDIFAYGMIPNELKDIYGTFHYYDTVTVVREYHHRMGRLVQHSDNSASEKAQRQYATLRLAEELLTTPAEWLKDHFLEKGNDMIILSGIQPKRQRIRVAEALCALLGYFGGGVVYNPFAGCAIAAAMIGGGEDLYVDGDANDKLLAIAKLLCYGTGQEGCHVEKRDSTKWIQGSKADYVLSTYLGYIDGKSAFDFCLGRCLEGFEESGKFAGIVAPKDIFEKQSEEMKEALRRDWVDSIVLLPFGEVAVLIDAGKERGRKDQVRFYNLTHPMLKHRPLFFVIRNDMYASILRRSDVKRKGFLKSLVTPTIEQQEGRKLISLGDLFEKMPRRTWPTERVRDDSRVQAWINRKNPYDPSQCLWMQGIEKRPIVSLIAPGYKLQEDCLIVNSKGELEPRFFDADQGRAFFQDGYAFRIRPSAISEFREQWLLELNEPYVSRQLHPYGQDEMLPESFSEDQVLALKINRPKTRKEIEEENKERANAGILPVGQQLLGGKKVYTIHRFLGHGYFGYAYVASSHNLETGENKEVVLKEYYPWDFYHREGIKAVINNPMYDDANRDKFIEESRIMKWLGSTPDSHIVPAFEHFHCEETDTEYYVMPFYKDGSLKDLQDSGFSFSEEMLIHHVVTPMCMALNLAHKNRVLHLDIKPENILVDEKGDAILIDFGVAKQYDKTDCIINSAGMVAGGTFCAPELTTDGMVRFGPQPDIYGLAATLFYLATDRDYPHPIMDFGEQDEDIRISLDVHGFSMQFADAIVAGLEYMNRPRNAQEFFNLFPGCEGKKL